MTAPSAEFRRHRRGKVLLLVAEPIESAALALGLLEANTVERLQCHGVGGGGRATNAVLPLPGRSERLQIRPFHHGGWLRAITRDRLMSLTRPISELLVNARLAKAGAPVPRPALVVGQRRGPGLWTAAVGTLHEESCCNGREFLATDPSRDRLAAAARAAGAALRRLHDAGGCHADLHLGNLLIRETGGAARVVFVDLDRARIVRAVPVRRRSAEMTRLYRSLLKRGHAVAAAPETIAHFFDAYCEGDRALRAELSAALRRKGPRIALHRVGYRLGGRGQSAQ